MAGRGVFESGLKRDSGQAEGGHLYPETGHVKLERKCPTFGQFHVQAGQAQVKLRLGLWFGLRLRLGVVLVWPSWWSFGRIGERDEWLDKVEAAE